jgi:hypothetical protein
MPQSPRSAPDLALDRIFALPGDWHAAGCLGVPALRALAARARQREVSRSLETGCGKSTLLLSHLSPVHQVFALDHVGSLAKVRGSPLLRAESVTFIEGPTQKTLPAHVFAGGLDLALLDGPHAYPFPQLEYYYVYPHLKPGSLLVVDDIHIPTVRHLFDFLREDEMFRLLEVVATTAFLERTPAPTFDPVADGWWLQNYNATRVRMPGRSLMQRLKRAFRGVRGGGARSAGE